jgi:hypothetical protein
MQRIPNVYFKIISNKIFLVFEFYLKKFFLVGKVLIKSFKLKQIFNNLLSIEFLIIKSFEIVLKFVYLFDSNQFKKNIYSFLVFDFF